MSYMLRNCCCVPFLFGKPLDKYCFQILSPKNAQIASLKNPDLDLIRRIHPECGFYGFMIRFWICPKNPQIPCLDSEIRIWIFPKTPHPPSIGCLDAPAVLPTRHCDDFIDFFLTPSSTLNSQWIGKITTQGKDK